MWTAVVAAVLLTLWPVVQLVRGQTHPILFVLVGPVLLLVSVRRSVLGWPAEVLPPEMAATFAAVSWVGPLVVVLGALMWAVGLWRARSDGDALPVAQVGAWMAAAGLVWGPWAGAQADLWAHWDAPWATLEATRAGAAAELAWGVGAATVVMVLGYLPLALWGWGRERWLGLGDAVAAAVVLLVALRTGQPAREAVDRATAPWARACAAPLAEGLALGRGSYRDLPARPVRWRGGLEVWDGSGWRDDLALPPGPVAWVAPANTAVAEVRGWQAAVGATGPVLVAGGDAGGPAGVFDLGSHPVVRAGRCRPHAIPSTAEGSATVGALAP